MGPILGVYHSLGATLFEAQFGKGSVQVESHGNVVAAIALLHGVAAGELRRRELEFRDEDYQVPITLRAVRSA
jgi:hypothetical protein